MSSTVLKEGTIVILPACYCGEPGCTENNPCKDCMDICSTFELTENTVAKYKGQVQDQ